MLFSIHSGIAALTQQQQLALSEPEAHALAQGIVNVARHYEFLSGASAKAVDWSNLFTIAAMIYGPRFYTMQQRNAPSRERRQAETPQAPAAARGYEGAPGMLSDMIPPGPMM